jgi:hypothetical protein
VACCMGFGAILQISAEIDVVCPEQKNIDLETH